MEGELAENQPDVFFSAGDSPSRLHDQCHRIAEFLSTEDHKNASRFSFGRSGDEIDLAGIAKYRKEVDNADQRLEISLAAVCDYL